MATVAGCAHRVTVAAPPIEAPTVTDTAPASSRQVATTAPELITTCVIQDGKIRVVAAQYDMATGDTTIDGRRFSDVYPAPSPPYAEGVEWFARMDPVRVGPPPYDWKFRYGLPITFRARDLETLQRVGERDGVPLFAEHGIPAIIFVPLRGCEFQPYQAEYDVGPVRGR
ncbi:MAG: hypothetical protein JO306_13160 [Gemmatimonadetes bacterium]|nr:hypothetical protein [Gemmatimonadota bacterium]